jgi:hypothetical protein
MISKSPLNPRNPKSATHNPKSVIKMICTGVAKRKSLFERTGLIRLRQRFLDGGMCERHVRSNTKQLQKHGIVPSLMPCIA